MRFVAALLLLLAAAPAWSGWTLVSGDSSGTLYADFEAVQQREELREVWTMYSEKARVDRASSSTKALVLFDCKYEKYQTVSVESYSGETANEASGGSTAEIYDDLSQPWVRVARYSIYEKIFSEICPHRLEQTAMTR